MGGFFDRTLLILEFRRERLIRRLESWPQEWLTCSRGPGDWSVLQVVEHLIRTERAVRQVSEETLTQAVSRPSFAERCRAAALLLLFRLPVRVRVPQEVQFVQPDRPESLASLMEEWEAERALLRQFLSRTDPGQLPRTAMRHPAAGALSLRDTLRFLNAHFLHHEYQIRRVMVRLGHRPRRKHWE